MTQPLDDLVVVIPGILGSTLHRDGKDVWAPTPSGILHTLRHFGQSITSLELPVDIGDEHPDDGVVAGGLMPDLHLVPGLWTHHLGYDRLLDWLRTTFRVIESDPLDPTSIPNLITFPYDWRLSNRYNAARLGRLVEPALERLRTTPGREHAKVVFLCHSMGGLVARWYISELGGAEVTRRLITFGTPFRGSIDALDQLVNGVRKGWGPFKLDLTAMTRSLPSVHQLLPEYECIEVGRSDGGVRYAKTTEIDLPDLSEAHVADAMAFHDRLDESHDAVVGAGTRFHPFVGYDQPTATTARLDHGRVTTLNEFDGNVHTGDGTVPRLAAAPKVLDLDDPAISAVNEQHGTLQHNDNIFDLVEGILRAPTGRKPRSSAARGTPTPTATIGVASPDTVVVGEPVDITLSGTGERLAITVTDVDSRATQTISVPRARGGGDRTIRLDELAPGAHTVAVRSDEGRPLARGSVTAALLVWDLEMA